MSYKWQNDCLILSLSIVPNSKKDECMGRFDNTFKIKITAPATENKANTHLIKMLAKYFNVPKSSVTLLKGQMSKVKTISIKAPKTIPAWLDDDNA